MTEKPLVTVYIPTFNRLFLLKRAVKSVLEQDYKNIELIVIDDCSKDGTVEYLKAISEKDSRVTYFINERNSGACFSRNMAINAASGLFITGLDDDDYFTPLRISTFVAAWENKQEKTIGLFSNTVFIKNNGKKTRTNRKITVNQEDLLEVNHIGNQVFTKTSCLRAMGGFDERLPAWQDYECWYRLLSPEDSQLECVKNATYVVDISHMHERIGHKSKQKKFEALQIFADRHNIKGYKLDSLKVISCESAKVSPTLKLLMGKLMFRCNHRNILLTVRVFVKSKIGAWSRDINQ